jgi:hypothetical protein
MSDEGEYARNDAIPTKSMVFLNDIALYFAELFLTQLYKQAVDAKTSGQCESVTLGYREIMSRYNKLVSEKPEFYAKLLSDMNRTYTKKNKFHVFPLTEFIDLFVREFVPTDFFNSLNKDHKRKILNVVIIDSMRKYARCVSRDHFKMIIDDHDNPILVQTLQDTMLNILLHQKDKMYHRFMSDISESGEQKESDLLRLQKDIRAAHKENHDLRANVKDLENQVADLTTQLADMQENSKVSIKWAKHYKELYEKEKNKRLQDERRAENVNRAINHNLGVPFVQQFQPVQHSQPVQQHVLPVQQHVLPVQQHIAVPNNTVRGGVQQLQVQVEDDVFGNDNEYEDENNVIGTDIEINNDNNHNNEEDDNNDKDEEDEFQAPISNEPKKTESKRSGLGAPPLSLDDMF